MDNIKESQIFDFLLILFQIEIWKRINKINS